MNADEMRAKLSYSRDRLEAAQQAKAEAEKLSASAREIGGGIPGFGGSGSQRAAATVRGAYSRADRAHREADERIAKWTHRVKSLERRLAETQRVRFTREDVVGAEFIHDGTSWRQVRKVNAKTVSVETGYSWVDRVPFDKIRSVRPEVTR
ncbi:hypothetical protein [Microbacterium sp.]|uniref:hypothetical protein n=1 Tax=Microbacterium sp. TaxID=51671 RepID=UPI003A9046F1